MNPRCWLLDEPTSPRWTRLPPEKIEESPSDRLLIAFTVIIVTMVWRQAARISDRAALSSIAGWWRKRSH